MSRRNEMGNTSGILFAIDQLEGLVSNSTRFPVGRKVMIDEYEFVELVEEIRNSLPIEMRDASRLLKERERIITEAQDQANRIVNDAQRHASILVSDHTILEEAKQLAEKMLRDAEQQQKAAQGEMEVFFINQIDAISKAALAVMGSMEGTVDNALRQLDAARKAIDSPSPDQF